MSDRYAFDVRYMFDVLSNNYRTTIEQLSNNYRTTIEQLPKVTSMNPKWKPLEMEKNTKDGTEEKIR